MVFRIEEISLDGGARLGISPLPGRWGEGLADISSILKWGADIVVSMTEQSEMERHNMGDLGAVLEQAGCQWCHFPIRDFGAPSPEADWQGLAPKLHAVLDEGGAVLAHCYGGQGRSGMVLLRLLVERGVAPLAALNLLRSIRPGAVETDAQFDWAAQASKH